MTNVNRTISVLASSTEVWRAARLLVKQYGEDAPIHAAWRADELLDGGDLAGGAAWKAIKRAAETLLATGGVTVH